MATTGRCLACNSINMFDETERDKNKASAIVKEINESIGC